MSQMTFSVGWAANGSITAVDGSGISVMSDSLIAFQPAIDEPSNCSPCSKTSSSIVETCCETCCIFPRGSVKRRSTYLTSFSLISAKTFDASAIYGPPYEERLNRIETRSNHEFVLEKKSE